MSRVIHEIRYKYRVRFGIQAGLLLRREIRKQLFSLSVCGVGTEVSSNIEDQAQLSYYEDKSFLDSRFIVTLEGNNKEVLESVYSTFIKTFAKINGATCE